IDFGFTIGKLYEFNINMLKVYMEYDNLPPADVLNVTIDWNEPGRPVCVMKVVDEVPITTCYMRNNLLACTLQNINVGNFTILVEYIDERCKACTTWLSCYGRCIWKSKIMNAVEGPPMTQHFTVVTTSTSIVLVIMEVFLVILIMVIIFRGIYICSKKPHLSLRSHEDKFPETKRLKILLLYPHDCKEFMDLMTTFRILLEEYTTFEVYDCFDKRHAESIGKNKVDWMWKHVMNTQEKIIVMETQCAELHQEAVMNNCKMKYFEPHWLDDLFTYAIKALTEDITNNTYDRVFVVRIEAFADQKVVLRHLSPFTRFVLPQDFKALISQISQSPNEHHVFLSDDENVNLQDLMNALICYKTDNPKYLSQLVHNSS
ncbi:hypothetical protein L9F63_019624, partial [Diploptera punctata]